MTSGKPTRRSSARDPRLLVRILESRRATFGMALLGTFALVALFADVVTADQPIFRASPAGFELFPDAGSVAPEGAFELGPLLSVGPTAPSPMHLASPSAEHWLGTDAQGRDVLARLIHGARVAIGTGIVVALLGVLGGALAGAVSSQYTRRLGPTLERAAQAVDAFPALIIVALFRAVEGSSSTLSVVIGASIVQLASVARLVRAELQRLGAEDFVLSARALGASKARIVMRHLLPHIVPSLVSSAALGLSAVVMLEATLSFLGLGPPIAGASWGEMLAQGARHPDHGPLFFLPALLLSLTIGSAYLFAEAVRDASDPVSARANATPPARTHS